MILKNKHTILILCLFAIGATANGQGQQWTLKQCLDYAHSNNIQIRQADLRIQESELNKKQSVASLFPSVTASTSVGLNRQNVRNSMNEYMSDNTVNARYNVGASLRLFNGLKQYNSIKQNELNVQIQEVEKENTVFNTDLSIIRSYMQIAYLKESVTALEGSVASSKAQLDLSEQKLKAGAISQSDHAQVEAQ
jgi:outer membrane protein